MGSSAAVVIVLAALTHGDPAASRLLPLLTAAIRAGPEAAAPSLSVVSRILGSTAFRPPVRQSDGDTAWERFESTDGRCAVDLGPIVNGNAQKLIAGCGFTRRAQAATFLNEMVTATAAEWRPPVVFAVDVEIAHIAVILVHRRPIAAEAYLSEEGDDRWRATVVLAVGGRTVVPRQR